MANSEIFAKGPSPLCTLAKIAHFEYGLEKLQKFGFIKRVDRGEIITVKDLES